MAVSPSPSAFFLEHQCPTCGQWHEWGRDADSYNKEVLNRD